MKNIFIIAFVLTYFVFGKNSYAQNNDTIIDTGKYNLHFSIIKGKGTPILFEAGSGNDGTVWKSIAKQVAKITGTTVITYDRAGMGKSKIKDSNLNTTNHKIQDGVEALELGLKKLGYDNEIILVAHSFGGLYTTLFTTRNKSKVSHVVFVDASISSFYTQTFVEQLNKMAPGSFLNQLKKQKSGLFYEIKNFDSTLSLLSKTKFPKTVPVIDLVASNPYNPFKNETDKNRWFKVHKQFTDESPNRELFIINKANHYAFKSNPNMVVFQIIKAYATSVEVSKSKEILLETLQLSIQVVNPKTEN